jgi:SAM-dependent methyltransferase
MPVSYAATPNVVNDIPRFVPKDNYAESFGFQWNRFVQTQIDRERDTAGVSGQRLFIETGWWGPALDGLDILEVGSGAGRFTRALLTQTKANIYSLDYSNAVEANWRNNADVADGRLHLSQASIYEMPFPDNSFDKTLCLGVLQHTPDFAKSVAALVAKTKPRGEIVVDFYTVRGWWTKLHAKYMLRPFTKRMDHSRLLNLIDRNADRLVSTYRAMTKMGLGKLTRFLPVVDIDGTFPKGLTEKQIREWVVLDTFDMFSPEHDHPQTIQAVKTMFEEAGAWVTFAGTINAGSGLATVVRAVKRYDA